MTRKDQFKFASRVHRMIKDCYFKWNDPDGLTLKDGMLCRGNSSITENIEYIYSEDRVKNHRQELMDLCKILPKTALVSPESGKCLFIEIRYLDMLCELIEDGEAWKKQCITADHFCNLMSVSGLAALEPTTLDNGAFFTDLRIRADQLEADILESVEESRILGIDSELYKMLLEREHSEQREK